MKKIFAILLIVAFIFSMTLIFASCGGTSDSDTDTDTEADKPTTSDSGTDTGSQTETDKGTESETNTETNGGETSGPVYYTVYVEDQLGQPVEGVDLQICNDKLCLPQKITDAEGVAKYEYNKLESFKVQINDVPDGYVMTTEKTHFPEGKTVVKVVIKRLETYVITATDMHGKALENILVELLDGALEVVDSVVTGEDGKASFTVEPGDSYTAAVSHSEGNYAFSPVGGHQISFENGKKVNVQFTISNAAFFYTVFVKDENGASQEGVELLLYDKSLKLIGSGTTKENGAHSFNLVNGDYFVVVNSKNGLYADVVEFKKNHAMTADMILSEEAAGSSRNTAIFLPGDIDVSLEKDASLWYSVPDYDGKVIEIESKTAIIRYGIEDYSADENGVIRVALNSKNGGKFKLSTSDEAGEKITGIVYRPGSKETPFKIDATESYVFDIKVPENKEVYYSFVADKDGTVRIESTTEYAYILINGNPNKKSVKAGETVLICFASKNDSSVDVEYPEIVISATMTFAQTKADYNVNVLLENEISPNAKIELYKYENDEYTLIKEATCDENGKYTFAGLTEAANYFIKAIFSEEYETQVEYLPFGDETSIDVHINHKRDGSLEYPFLVNGDEPESSTTTVALNAGEDVYYTIFYIQGATIAIDNKDVKLEVIIGGKTVEILTGEVLSYIVNSGDLGTNSRVLLHLSSESDAEVKLIITAPKQGE